MSNQNGGEDGGSGLGAECAGGIMTSGLTSLLMKTLTVPQPDIGTKLAVLET